jgi:DNA-binding transcriptional MerR regulator
MRIGELARRTGLTVETLRFYERARILGAVTRDASGYRVYEEQTYRTLVTVRWAQELGLRLEDIAAALLVHDVPQAERVGRLQRTVDERLAVLREEIVRLERTIASLQALRAIPFRGDCIMPAAFVDQLVLAHEGREGSAIKPAKPAPPRRTSVLI